MPYTRVADGGGLAVCQADRVEGSSLCERSVAVIVAASTDCFPDLPLLDIFDRLAELEFSSVEIAIGEGNRRLTPTQVLEDPEKAVSLCRDTHRLGIAAYAVDIPVRGEPHYEQFAACCRLAKATKVACISVPSGELGTPFNEEVEHLRRLVAIATLESAVVSIRSQIGRLSEDPDTAVVLCDNVKGLGVTLDPSHYTCEPNAGRHYEKLFKYTHHVQFATPARLNCRSASARARLTTAGCSTCSAPATIEPSRSTSIRCRMSTIWPNCASCGCCWKACSEARSVTLQNIVVHIYKHEAQASESWRIATDALACACELV